MTAEDLEDFVASYESQGAIETEGGVSHECEALAFQRPNGNVRVLCVFPMEVAHSLWRDHPVRYFASTNDSRELAISGLLLAQTHLPFEKEGKVMARGYLHAQEIRVGSPGLEPPTSYRYALTNYPVVGDNAYVESDEERYYAGDALHIQHPVARIVLQRLLKEQSKDLGQADRSDARVTATASIESGHRETARAIVDDLVLLLSLAQGCRISWILEEAVSHDKIVETTHRDTSTGPFARFELVHSQQPGDVREFLEGAWPELEGARSAWRIQDLIKLFAEAVSSGDHLETKCMRLAVALDTLKGIFLERQGRTFVLPPSVFDPDTDAIRKKLHALLVAHFSSRDAELLEPMAAHAAGLNWYPTRRGIKEMYQELALFLSTSDRGRLLRIRNSLIHAARFDANSGKPLEQFHFLRNEVGRLLLAILGYRGHYLDWTCVRKEGRTTVDHLRKLLGRA